MEGYLDLAEIEQMIAAALGAKVRKNCRKHGFFVSRREILSGTAVTRLGERRVQRRYSPHTSKRLCIRRTYALKLQPIYPA